MLESDRSGVNSDVQPVTIDSDRWNLPRYICGHHWQASEALRDILCAPPSWTSELTPERSLS